ncbi:MAG: hypothetical protein LBS96_09335 [Oscillospiraceae bacterium]|jgi:hypothetical protein|nr:hypothetical protein [Oscillospiraceae bacterium]
MPSVMQHLQVAWLLCPAGSPRYFAGALAPDGMRTWQAKEIAHLRTAPNRAAALADLARRTDPADDFAQAALLHLFVDWKWDTGPLRRFVEARGCRLGENHNGRPPWLDAYHHELGLASAWLHRSAPWAGEVWQKLFACDPATYSPLPGITPEDIFDFITRSHRWLEENRDAPPSTAFPPEMSEAFAVQVSKDYVAIKT